MKDQPIITLGGKLESGLFGVRELSHEEYILLSRLLSDTRG